MATATDSVAETTAPEEMPEREIVLAREFNAPRELVWEAMTDPKHVVNWWGPRGFKTSIETMDVRPGGIWKHVMHGPDGANYPNKSIFREVEKPERIVYSHGGGREHGPGAHFVATWTFEALAADKTRVTIRMVFPTTAERDLVVREFGAIEGGKQTLARLGEHLAAMQTREFVITREVDAPRELVWKAWTERDCLMQWFGPKGVTIPSATLDFRQDGSFHYCMRGADGGDMWGKWVFREIVAPEKIVWENSFADSEGNITPPPFDDAWPLRMFSVATFAERGNKTIITIQWLPLDATEEERATFEKFRDGMTQGWDGTFEKLEEFLAQA